MKAKPNKGQKAAMVLYGLLRRKGPDGKVQFLMVRKQGHLTFPPTKFRPGENLNRALVRPLEEDLNLAQGSYYPEEELEMIPNHGDSIRYPGLTKQWYLYPVTISLTPDAVKQLEALKKDAEWMTLNRMMELLIEYQKEFKERDYEKIALLAKD